MLDTSRSGNRLLRVWDATHTGEVFQRIQCRSAAPTAATGPFTPAPPGLYAVLGYEIRVPVAFYDVRGRPVIIDADEQSRALHLARDDEGLVRIEGNPPDGS